MLYLMMIFRKGLWKGSLHVHLYLWEERLLRSMRWLKATEWWRHMAFEYEWWRRSMSPKNPKDASAAVTSKQEKGNDPRALVSCFLSMLDMKGIIFDLNDSCLVCKTGSLLMRYQLFCFLFLLVLHSWCFGGKKMLASHDSLHVFLFLIQENKS